MLDKRLVEYAEFAFQLEVASQDCSSRGWPIGGRVLILRVLHLCPAMSVECLHCVKAGLLCGAIVFAGVAKHLGIPKALFE